MLQRTLTRVTTSRINSVNKSISALTNSSVTRTFVAQATSSSSSSVQQRSLHSTTMSSAAPSTVGPNSNNGASASDLWNPTQYLLFDEMRARPGRDLIARLQATLKQRNIKPEDVKTLGELGCGTGKLALQLAEEFPHAQIVGVDSSANMLESAKKATAKTSESVQKRMQWQQLGFEEYKAPTSAGVDVIFSNAALHWRPQDHATIFPHLLSQLSSTGVLAVQMPNNFREPSHLNMLATLKEGKFFATEAELNAVWSKQPDVHLEGTKYYYHLLAPHARYIDAWQTEFLQPISSTTKYHPVLEWTKSTALAPILASLKTEAEQTRFQELYSAKLEQAYPYFTHPISKEKLVLFPFKRIFLIATK